MTDVGGDGIKIFLDLSGSRILLALGGGVERGEKTTGAGVAGIAGTLEFEGDSVGKGSTGGTQGLHRSSVEYFGTTGRTEHDETVLVENG